jgi:CheY-like chemotaxis protein
MTLRARILVVDDNPTNLKLVAFLLTSRGYEIRAVMDAESVIKTLESWRPHLILMDIQLPGMDGFELTGRLKSDPRTRDIVIVALTAYAMKGDDTRATEAGCDGYIAKPIDTRAFPETIETYLKCHVNSRD